MILIFLSPLKWLVGPHPLSALFDDRLLVGWQRLGLYAFILQEDGRLRTPPFSSANWVGFCELLGRSVG